MQKRTSLMVAYDLLRLGIFGATKTQLVYRGNLNFRLIKKWLSRLISKGLIEFYPGPPKTWGTTEKGVKFLLAMDKVMAIWDDGLIHMDIMKQEVTT